MIRAKATLVLVDGSNLYASVKALDYTPDYKKLIDSFEDEGLLRAIYFTAMRPSDELSSIRPMVDYMEYNGWSIVQKTVKEWHDPATGETKTKGNMDIEIAVTAMELAHCVTDIILFSGDGDFRFLIEKLQAKGVRVTVVSTIQTKPSMCADELRRQADKFIDLNDPDFKAMIKRSPAPFKAGFRRAV